jgi:hypothetical protein
MTSAQASVGAAATSPITGMILIPAEATRQGAAAAPQLLKKADSKRRLNIRNGMLLDELFFKARRQHNS